MNTIVSLRRSTVQKMRELIMDIPSGTAPVDDSGCWVYWMEWEQYCVRATRVLEEIDKQVMTPTTPTNADEEGRMTEAELPRWAQKAWKRLNREIAARWCSQEQLPLNGANSADLRHPTAASKQKTKET